MIVELPGGLHLDTKSWVIELRREFHRYPELSGQEVRTSARVEEILKSLGIETRRAARTGVVGTLRGKAGGKTIGLRADMDALEQEEKTGLPFASEHKGVMHACGHDAHTAMLLGAARELAGQKDSLKGTVVFLFQPAEEGLGGARMMVEDGALQGVDAVFGEHVLAFPGAPAGTVATGPGPMLAGMAMFKAIFKGKGGHGAMPHLSVDTVVPACHAITSMESIVTKEIDSAMRTVISVGQVHGGTRMNIIADETWFDGSVRFFAPEVAGLVEEKMGRILRSTAEAFRTSVDFQYRKGVPPTVNDPEMGALAVEVAKRVVGAGKVMPISPVMGSEDFAYYSERVPGVYVGLSASKGDGKDYPNHHPQFDINEDMLEVGTTLHVEFAKAFLAR